MVELILSYPFFLLILQSQPLLKFLTPLSCQCHRLQPAHSQADAAGFHTSPPENNAVFRQSPGLHDRIPTQSAIVLPALSSVGTKVNTSDSQAVDGPEVKPRPKLVRRVPLQDRPVQRNIPRLELVDPEPAPRNPNLVHRVKRAETSESMSALQPPLPIHTYVEVEALTPAAAESDGSDHNRRSIKQCAASLR